MCNFFNSSYSDMLYWRQKLEKGKSISEFYNKADASELSDEELRLFNERREMLL